MDEIVPRPTIATNRSRKGQMVRAGVIVLVSGEQVGKAYESVGVVMWRQCATVL